MLYIYTVFFSFLYFFFHFSRIIHIFSSLLYYVPGYLSTQRAMGIRWRQLLHRQHVSKGNGFQTREVAFQNKPGNDRTKKPKTRQTSQYGVTCCSNYVNVPIVGEIKDPVSQDLIHVIVNILHYEKRLFVGMLVGSSLTQLQQQLASFRSVCRLHCCDMVS